MLNHPSDPDLATVCVVQCEAMIRQGLVRRVFGEWQRLCQERDWKTQLATRDNEIKRMDREVCPPSSFALTTTKRTLK